MKKVEIKLLTGFNELLFGSAKHEIIEALGTADQFETIEEEDEVFTEMHTYNDLKSSFFFEGNETDMVFTSCDTENENALLFGNKVFEMSELEIKQMMREHNFKDLETDEEEWGEKRLSYMDAMVDFYFDNEELISVTWGILVM
jgi:hypothetical protein